MENNGRTTFTERVLKFYNELIIEIESPDDEKWNDIEKLITFTHKLGLSKEEAEWLNEKTFSKYFKATI